MNSYYNQLMAVLVSEIQINESLQIRCEQHYQTALLFYEQDCDRLRQACENQQFIARKLNFDPIYPPATNKDKEFGLLLEIILTTLKQLKPHQRHLWHKSPSEIVLWAVSVVAILDGKHDWSHLNTQLSHLHGLLGIELSLPAM